jgi:hypothetical protein
LETGFLKKPGFVYLYLSLLPAIGACTGTPEPPRSAAWTDKVWRVTSPPGRAPGSFYIFLSSGTLVMTSCVETYRLATWMSEPNARLRIVEDIATEYGAEIRSVSDRDLALRLLLKNEQVDLVLESAVAPYVCPDLPR